MLNLVIYSILLFLNIDIIYFAGFTIGYVLGREKSIDFRKYSILTMLMLLAVALRLLLKAKIDGSILYDTVVVDLSQLILGFWIFQTIVLMYRKSPFVKRVADSKVISYLDSISFYVYLTHYFFLGEQVNLRSFPVSMWAQIVMFAIMSMVSAILLRWIYMNLNRYLIRAKRHTA